MFHSSSLSFSHVAEEFSCSVGKALKPDPSEEWLEILLPIFRGINVTAKPLEIMQQFYAELQDVKLVVSPSKGNSILTIGGRWKRGVLHSLNTYFAY